MPMCRRSDGRGDTVLPATLNRYIGILNKLEKKTPTESPPNISHVHFHKYLTSTDFFLVGQVPKGSAKEAIERSRTDRPTAVQNCAHRSAYINAKSSLPSLKYDLCKRKKKMSELCLLKFLCCA